MPIKTVVLSFATGAEYEEGKDEIIGDVIRYSLPKDPATREAGLRSYANADIVVVAFKSNKGYQLYASIESFKIHPATTRLPYGYVDFKLVGGIPILVEADHAFKAKLRAWGIPTNAHCNFLAVFYAILSDDPAVVGGRKEFPILSKHLWFDQRVFRKRH